MSWAWDLPLKANEKLVILAIADAANDDGFAFPGYSRLLQKTGLGRATLAKQLKILADAGLFSKESHGIVGKGRGVNTYTLNLSIDISELKKTIEIARKNNAESAPELKNDDTKSSHHEPRKVHTPNTISSPPEQSKSSAPELKNDDTKSSHPEPRKVHTPNTISSPPEHEQSVEQSVKQRSVKKDIAKTFVLPSWVDKSIWDQWMIVRKEKKQVNTDIALNGLIDSLIECEKAGITPTEAMTIAIKNSWAGLKLKWILNLQNNEKSQPPATNRGAGFHKQPMQRPDYSKPVRNGDAIDSTCTVDYT
jgi:hypothetical protein